MNQSSITTSLVREALQEYTATDERGIQTLIHSIQHQVDDVTTEEIVQWSHIKGKLVREGKSRIPNPFGFMLAVVPRAFEGQAFQDWRKRKGGEDTSQQAQNAAAAAQMELQHYQAVLMDREASEAEKEAARAFLDAIAGPF